MSKTYSISEEELADLEKTIPDIYESFMAHCKPRDRVMFNRMKKVLSDIRWRGGPHTEVYEIPADEDIDDHLPDDSNEE